VRDGFRMNEKPVPVIMFHTVRPRTLPWYASFLSCPPDIFEGYLQYLKSRHYETIGINELVDHIYGRAKLPPRSIALTFDDGYLDNWTIVVPLLKKYGYKGTIFVNPEFVDPRDIIRKQWDCAENITRDQVDGMVSWAELRSAQTSGVLDVQSHSMTHTWYFTSNRIIDFHHPGDKYPWLAWNADPQRKHLWMSEDQSEIVGFGTPVYENAKAMVARRYFENEELQARLANFVRENGGKEFFTRPDWREVLRNQVVPTDLDGTYESEEDRRKRIDWELQASKEIISDKLGKPVDIICWPGGGSDPYSREAALRIGYRAWTVSALKNRFGCSIPEIGRIGIPVINGEIGGRAINRMVFAYQVEGYRESGAWHYAKSTIRRIRRSFSPRQESR